MWQIFEFSTYKKSPPVKQLAIYLPEEKLAYFEEDVIAVKLQKRMDDAQLILIAFLTIII